MQIIINIIFVFLCSLLDRERGTAREARISTWLFEPFIVIPMGAIHFYLAFGITDFWLGLAAGVAFWAGMAPGWSFIGDFLARRPTAASEWWQFGVWGRNYHFAAIVRGLMIGLPFFPLAFYVPHVVFFPLVYAAGFYFSLLLAREVDVNDRWHAAEYIRGAITAIFMVNLGWFICG